MQKKNYKLVVSCEHASNILPKKFQTDFKGKQAVLASHQGYDLGAQVFAKKLATIANFSSLARFSRLLIDLNRSLHHAKLFSDYTRHYDNDTKEYIINEYYYPYRNELQQVIAQYIKKQFLVIHISVHSFTPRLGTEVRNNDIGLLYDPSRSSEKQFAMNWQMNIQKLSDRLIIRRNYPYKGISDGLTTHFRKRWSQADYIGIELELNQKNLVRQNLYYEQLLEIIYTSLLNNIH